MTRKQFMEELRDRLSRLPASERDAALAYYEEYFDEAGSDREQEVIRELGSPASVASRILADYAVKEARDAPFNPRKGFSAFWAVLLAIFAAPLAIPAVIAIIGIIIAILATVVAVGAAAIALFVGGIAVFAGGFLGLFSMPASALILFGVAFILWGAGKIIFVIIGAVLSLLGRFTFWAFNRDKGDRYEK
jgi:uncharacterized membrane protein